LRAYYIEKFEPSCDKPRVRREIRVESLFYIYSMGLVGARACVLVFSFLLDIYLSIYLVSIYIYSFRYSSSIRMIDNNNNREGESHTHTCTYHGWLLLLLSIYIYICMCQCTHAHTTHTHTHTHAHTHIHARLRACICALLLLSVPVCGWGRRGVYWPSSGGRRTKCALRNLWTVLNSLSQLSRWKGNAAWLLFPLVSYISLYIAHLKRAHRQQCFLTVHLRRQLRGRTLLFFA